MTALIRRWLIAGLLVWLPLGVTLLLLRTLVGALDTSLLLIPRAIRPDLPLLGVLLSLALVLGTGAFAANLFGRRVVAWIETLFERVPLLGSVYGGMKKLATTVFSNTGNSFRQVFLIEYPRKGIWTIAFQTGQTAHEIAERTGQDLLTVFVPTTPNPTSGFVLLVPRSEAIPLAMPVDEGLRLVISMGVVTPEFAAAAKQEVALPPFPKLG